jgi:hypothetical protein
MQNAANSISSQIHISYNSNDIEILSLIDNLTPNTIDFLNAIKHSDPCNTQPKPNFIDKQFTFITLENKEIQLKFDEINKEKDFLTQELTNEKKNSMFMENKINLLRIEKQLYVNLSNTLSKEAEESQKTIKELKTIASDAQLDLLLNKKKHECLKKEFEKLELINKELADKLNSNRSNRSNRKKNSSRNSKIKLNDEKEHYVKRKFDTFTSKDEGILESKEKGNKLQSNSPVEQRIVRNLNNLFDNDLEPSSKEAEKKILNIRKVQFQFTNCEISNNSNNTSNTSNNNNKKRKIEF